jgi:cobalt/nickel transport system permease protein
MRLARVARGFHAGKHLLDRHTMRTIAYTAGMLLVKAYERGNKIYDALVARGYDGSIKPLTAQRIKNIDYVFCISLIIMAIYLIYIDWQINMLIL